MFVHGIGSQPQSDTVRSFGQPLIDWLGGWHRAREVPGWRLESAELSYGGELRGPARIRLAVPAYAAGGRTWPAREWVLAEAWWATRLVAPDFLRMVEWSVRVLIRVVGTLIAQMVDRAVLIAARLLRLPGLGQRRVAYSDPGVFAALIELLSTLLFAVVYALAVLVGYLALVPLFVAAQIPIPALQRFILVRVLRPFLVDNVGEFTTFVEDEVQALNVRASVAGAVGWLTSAGGCEQVVVVAHSQGTVVAFDALCALDPALARYVKKFVTFGAALNRAFQLAPACERLRGTLPRHIFWLDVWSYYDPVPGGAMARPGPPALADPPETLRSRMHWGGQGPMASEVTNALNPLSDHGGYLRNFEQFVGRIACEIDDPEGYYECSRFYQPRQKERVRRRRVRVSTLVGWRLAAMLAGLGALAARLASGGWERLERDGRGVVEFVSAIPGHELLGLPGVLLGGVGTLAGQGAPPAPATGGALSLVDQLRSAWAGLPWEKVEFALVGALLFGALFALAYLALARVLFQPWDDRERGESLWPALPTQAWGRALIALRTLAVLLVLSVLALGVGRPA